MSGRRGHKAYQNRSLGSWRHSQYNRSVLERRGIEPQKIDKQTHYEMHEIGKVGRTHTLVSPIMMLFLPKNVDSCFLRPLLPGGSFFAAPSRSEDSAAPFSGPCVGSGIIDRRSTRGPILGLGLAVVGSACWCGDKDPGEGSGQCHTPHRAPPYSTPPQPAWHPANTWTRQHTTGS